MKLSIEFGSMTKELADSAQRSQRLRRIIWTRVRIVSFNLERYVKIRMPVDTGRARASWGHSNAPAALGDGIWIEDESKLALEQGSNVEYIEQLNEGSSQQAPAGFIDVEVLRAENDLAKGIESDVEKLA